MPNPKDFLLNTDYEIDKIILVKTGSFTKNVYIPHDLGFIPLPFGVWSTDPDFTTVNTLGVSDINSQPGYTPRLGVECEAYDDKVRIIASGDGSTTTTIYYRLYALEPPGLNATIAATSDLANKFVLNTDYNYRKLKAEGIFTQTGEEYAHNLGYIPQVMAWVESPVPADPDKRAIAPMTFASNFTGYKITVTDTKIIGGKTGVFGDKYYWRVYYDKA